MQNIKHTCGYNSGGIAEIYLLDIKDFVAYCFKDDALYDSCFVDRILKDVDTPYTTLSEVGESNFTETNDGALYRQQLTTFVNTLKSDKTNNLLKALGNKYLVVFRNMQGNIYSFGSDGGATLAFSQVSGQLGETAGRQPAGAPRRGEQPGTVGRLGLPARIAGDQPGLHRLARGGVQRGQPFLSALAPHDQIGGIAPGGVDPQRQQF